jgi:hypothetical protein
MYLTELSEVDSAFFGTLEALETAAKRLHAVESVHRLKSQMRNLAVTRDRLASYDERRPYIAPLFMLRRTIKHVEQMARSYLHALAAPTPWDAKRYGKAAQEHIDAAAAVLEETTLRVRAAALTAPPLPLGHTFAAVLSALEVLHPDQTLTELELKGQARYRQISGRNGGTGTGVTYLALQLVADVHLSPERFEQVIRDAAKVLASGQQELANQLTNGKVVRDLLAAKQRGLEGHAQMSLMLSAELDDEAMFRQMLRLYWVLFEEVGIPIMAIMLKVSGTERAYDRLTTDDAGTLAGRVEANESLKPLFYGLDKNYRNAASHGHTFRLEEDMAIFELRSFAERVPVEVVMDACYSLMESIYGIQLVLDAEISNLGIEAHQLQHMGPFQPSDLDTANAIIRAMGYDAQDSRITGSTWALNFSGDIESIAGLAKAVSTLAPSHVDTLEIEHVRDNFRSQHRLPLAAIRAFAAIDGADPIEEAINLLFEWHENDQPLLVKDRLRCAVASIAIRALSNDDLSSVSLLRKLRIRAVASNDAEASAAVAAIIRALRTKTTIKLELVDSLGQWMDGKLLALP